MKTITRKAAVKFIRESDGKIFAVEFVKRTTGELRKMVARTGVTKHLSPAPSKPGIDFKEHNLLSVFDMEKNGYRAIPADGITAVKIDGEWHEVK